MHQDVLDSLTQMVGILICLFQAGYYMTPLKAISDYAEQLLISKEK